MVTRRPEEDRAFVVALLRQLTAHQYSPIRRETTRLRQYFAARVLPAQPTPRVIAKHGKHVEDDLQWPDDTAPDEYLASLRDTVLDPRGGIYLAEPEFELTWTIYFVGLVSYRWRGRHHGDRVVVLFNAERLFWITGFQAEDGEAYVELQQGFWVQLSG